MANQSLPGSGLLSNLGINSVANSLGYKAPNMSMASGNTSTAPIGTSKVASSSAPIGVKTKNPTDNITQPSNTTNQPKTNTPATNSSTENGTSGNPQTYSYGQDVRDSSGNVIGKAMFDKATGKALENPNTVPNISAPQNTVPTQGYTPDDAGLYGKLVAALANQSSQSGQDYKAAQEEANRIQAQQTALANEYAQKTNNISGTAGFLTQQAGLQGQLQNQYNLGQSALASQYSGATNRLAAANTQQGLLQQALEKSAGFAQPQLASYGQQAFNPISGNFGGTTGSLQDAVNNVVQRLQNGTMTYSDALTALSGYGQGGVNALQQSLPSGFNIAQSNTLGGQQGSVGVNYQLAETALTNVEDIIKQLGAAQKTNVPAVNNIANWISTQFGIGSEQTRAMTGAVQSLRNAYASLLASVKGGTPTDYSSQAVAEIPNEPTPNDIAAVRKNFETLGKARKDILGNPGQAGGQGSGPGTASAGGYSFKLVNGKWVPA